MRLIQRYLFRQLLGPTIATTLALGLVALLSQTLSTIDLIVDQHQSALVFGKIVLLSLPQLISMILPIALFVATLVTLNRLHNEQEIVVCFAGGVSRWKVLTPFLRLAVFAALITLIANLWVAPWCQRQRMDELFRVKTDLLTSLVREGTFTQPGKGLTVYAQSSDHGGALHNIFIDQQKDDGSSTTFDARSGDIVIRDGKPAMVLRDGSNQSLSREGALNYLTFGEYVFDLTPYVNSTDVVTYKASDKYLHELLKPDLTVDEDKHNKKKYLAEAHSRISAPLYDLTVVLLAAAGVLGGTFSRTGYSLRIASVCAIALVVRILGFGAQAAAAGGSTLNILQYAVPLIPGFFAFRALFRVGRKKGATALRTLSPIGAT
jgi:lipopolysaccharide export system permease protein